MAGTQRVFAKSTDDDATCKVAGGGPSGADRPQPVGMFVINATDDDAKCKVVGGGAAGDIKKVTEFDVPNGKTVTLPPRPLPFTVRFSIEIGAKKVTNGIKGLKLSRGPKGLRIEVIKTGKG